MLRSDSLVPRAGMQHAFLLLTQALDMLQGANCRALKNNCHAAALCLEEASDPSSEERAVFFQTERLVEGRCVAPASGMPRDRFRTPQPPSWLLSLSPTLTEDFC